MGDTPEQNECRAQGLSKRRGARRDGGSSRAGGHTGHPTTRLRSPLGHGRFANASSMCLAPAARGCAHQIDHTCSVERYRASAVTAGTAAALRRGWPWSILSDSSSSCRPSHGFRERKRARRGEARDESGGARDESGAATSAAPHASRPRPRPMMTHASRVVILGQQRRCRGRQTRVAARGRGNNGADAAACKWRGARTRARGVPPCEARLVRLLSERSVPPKERPQPAHDEPRTHAHTPIPP